MFEFKNDLVNYLEQKDKVVVAARYMHLLDNLVNEFEKALILDSLYKNKNQDISGLQLSIILEKAITPEELNKIFNNEEMVVLRILSDDYNFEN